MRSLKSGSRVYLIAVAGTGMSALAGLLKQKGCVVAGSDIACYSPVRELLQALQVEVHLGYDVEDLKKFKPDYVVIGNFVRRDNLQAQYILENQIPCGSLSSTLEEGFLKNSENYVVVGTHGKSTTASCLAHLLTEAHRDPSYFIGAVPFNFGKSFQLGSGRDFVLEGDEYDTAFFDKKSKFLHYKPKIGIWTSYEFDHADIFKSIEDIERMFLKFLTLIPPSGSLLYCRDWEKLHELVQQHRSELSVSSIKSYGFHPQSDFPILEYVENEEGISFRLQGQRFSSFLSGRFNAQNLSAAVIAAQEAGVPLEILGHGVESFKGLKRRQELRAEVGPHRVIDDFAHHPTAVRMVIEGLKKKYPKEKLVVFFEPRSNTTRRNIFQKDFESAFSGADYVFLSEIFRKESLPESDRLSISQLVRALQQKGIQADGPLSTDEMLQKSKELSQDFPCSFVILSNGSFDELHQKLISLLKSL